MDLTLATEANYTIIYMVNLQNLSQPWFIYPIMWFIYPLMLWSLIWKGLALWRSAKNNQRYWFMALLVVNTVGILEIIYLKFFAKKAD